MHCKHRVHKQRRKPLMATKTKAQRDALRRLNSFIRTNNPQLVRFLLRIWKDQSDAITYKELRESILAGAMTEKQFTDWQSDYVNFFNTILKDRLLEATAAGGKGLATALLSDADVYKPLGEGIDNWIIVHGAEWITSMSDEAKETVSTMIRYTAKGNMTVDELAQVIRPTIGLTKPQSLANAKYYEAVKASIKTKLMEANPRMKESTAEKQAAKRARESAARYAGRQHRERAITIAETELAFAYNKGADDAVQQAIDNGLLPPMKSVWLAAANEGVCGICAALDGTSVNFGDSFDYKGKNLYAGQKRTPPAHPRCQCVLGYEEA